MNMHDEYTRWLERADSSLRDELKALRGEQGPQGVPEAQGEQGPQGEPEALGGQGPQGDQGPQGVPETLGDRGPQGDQGPQGVPEALVDAFYRDLAFGTGGLRGIVGAGPNRMNVHTVAKATQGLADYLNARFEAPSVAIARDSRRMGREFSETAAGVLAANGVRALLYPRIEPTPALSFAVRDLGCSAGVCVTASHNPAEYNGYKVYGPDGCQITTQAAREIQAAIDAVDVFDGVQSVPFEEALASGMASWIGEDTLGRFVDDCLAASLSGAAGTLPGEAGARAGKAGARAGKAGALPGAEELQLDSEASLSGAAGASTGPTGALPGEAGPLPGAEELQLDSEASLLGAAGPLKVVYTPLHGTGLECVSAILARIGVDDVVVEPAQAVPDGNFPTCPYPNPEVREALELGLALAAREQADLLLATDPDADRVGVAVVKDGQPVLLTGNEMGILLLDYACEMRAARGEDLRGKVVCTTIVSSAMADALAADRGFELRRTLTGFKFIGEQIGLLEAAGQADRFMFGFEESYGYLAGTHVRDKDAVVASMLICEMARWHRSRGMDLVDAMDELYARYGFYRNGLVSIAYPGADGAAKMAAIMTGLRAEPPAEVAGLAVERVVDYAAGAPMPVMGGCGDAAAQMLPPADVLELQLQGGNKLLVRPSGTEPKVKAYLFARADSRDEAGALLASLDAAARGLLGQ